MAVCRGAGCEFYRCAPAGALCFQWSCLRGHVPVDLFPRRAGRWDQCTGGPPMVRYIDHDGGGERIRHAMAVLFDMFP